MKKINQIPTILIRCCALVALTALVWLPTEIRAEDGTAKGGAGKLIQLKPIKTVEALQSIDAGDTIVMSCPKCKDTYATVMEKSFKGVNQDELKKTTIHLCAACDTKIVTKGHGKSAKDVVVHTCKTCGSTDVSCCVMKKGGEATPGMEKK